MGYYNPIIRGFAPDSTILNDDGDYYITVSSFEYLPGIPIFHSKDLVNWTLVNHVLTRESQNFMQECECSRGVYSAELRKHNGKYYIASTMWPQGPFITKANSVEGRWDDLIFVEMQGIDPSLFWEDEKMYMQLAVRDKEGEYSIVQFRLDENTGKILSDPVTLVGPGKYRDVEGSHLYRWNNLYYLICAGGGTREGHMSNAYRSNCLSGPYEESPYNPVISNVPFGREKIQNVGHCDIFKDQQGHWWCIALATRPIKHRHNLGRETVMMPIEWTEDGWPIVAGRKTTVYVDCDLLPEQKFVRGSSENFDNERLNPAFSSPRSLMEDRYEIDRAGKQLKLASSTWNLFEEKPFSFLGVRQQEYQFEVSCVIDFKPEVKDEAGLSVYMDTEHHYDLFLALRDGKRTLVLRKCVGEIIVEQCIAMERVEDLELIVKGDERYYNFYYKLGGNEIFY